MCAKLLGTHWYCKMNSLEEGAFWALTMKCQEMPECNAVESFANGIEKGVDNPIFMGKAKVN